MVQIFIHFPIWKTRSVGINHKMITGDLIVEILYTDASGERLYPHMYFMRKENALNYPVQQVTEKSKLHIIPISSFYEIKGEEAEYAKYCLAERIPFNPKCDHVLTEKEEPKAEEVEVKISKVDENKQQRMDWINN